ncbi:hypothetical protein ZWY2020_028965 [Hordeum vulgare]|nr:hypothetical protein ZWY2020_028965 [Hordeum vulgare]
MWEDEILRDAWFTTSVDLIHGMEEKGTTFWNNINIWFHEHKHLAPYYDAVIHNRELKSLNHRWYNIGEVVSTYCGHLKDLIERWPSRAQIIKQVS